MQTDTALPASLSAVHLALAMLRRHRAGTRGAFSPFVLPSFLFAAVPWIWASPTALAVGIAAHVLWLGVCEALAPPPARRTTAAATGGTRPTAPAPVASSRPPIAPTASARRDAAPGAAPAPRPGFQPTTVLNVVEECRDIRTLRLARPEGFEFQPGQFVPVRLQIDGKPHVRCYSISSAPDTRGYLEISVRRQGLVSGTLHATMRAGATLAINRPAGQFVYPAADDRPIALIAGGIGITPLLSMLRHAIASDPTRPVTLLYSARNEQEIAFLDELRVIAARHPQVKAAITLTQPTGSRRDSDEVGWRTGRVDAALVRQYVPAPSHTVFCMCGPGPMMADMSVLLTQLGAPASQIRFEHFETAVAASLINPAAEPERGGRAPAAAPQSSGDGYLVTFADSSRSAVASPAMTLLDAAEAAGVTIPTSCRSGVCQACRTRLKTGAADCRSDVLDPEDREGGFVLPCVTWATGDCVLEA